MFCASRTLRLGVLALLACGENSGVSPLPAPPPPPPSGSVATVTIESHADTVAVGGHLTLRAIPRGPDGTALEGRAVTWSSSNTTVASITSLGQGMIVVTGVAPGSATLTSVSESQQAAVVITVYGGADVVIASLLITGDTSPLGIGRAVPVSVIGRNAAGLVIPIRQLTWATATQGIVSVIPRSSDGATVTALALGTTTVTVRVGTVTASARFTTSPDGLIISPQSVAVASGDSIRLTASGVDASGLPVPGTPAVIWSSRNPEVITVSPTGWVVGRAIVEPGRGTGGVITATSQGLIAEQYIPVTSSYGSGTATVRYVHASSGLGPITLQPNKGAPVVLSFQETLEQVISAGNLSIEVQGFPPPVWYFQGQSYVGLLPPNSHLTLYSVLGSPQAALLPVWDNPPAVPSNMVAVRIVMSSGYTESYNGNNIYLLPPGAPIDTSPILCYFDGPVASDYFLRPAGSFDLALVNPDNFLLQPGNLGHEFARFHITPQPGRATTYVITGNDPASLAILAVLD
jgi:hypothetical protein